MTELARIDMSVRRLHALARIKRRVADYYYLDVAELDCDRRGVDVVRPRQLAMTLAKRLTTLSYPQIGMAFGGRDHTTVMHAVRRVRKLQQVDGQIARDLRRLQNALMEELRQTEPGTFNVDLLADQLVDELRIRLLAHARKNPMRLIQQLTDLLRALDSEKLQ
jgi:hypothetical protein